MNDPDGRKLVKVATWINDGTKYGRWEWEPGYGPPRRSVWVAWLKLVVVVLVYAAVLCALGVWR